MVLQVEHTVQHYKKVCQRHGKVFKIATTAFLFFIFLSLMADARTTRGDGREYCLSKCILVQMTTAH